jgi:hypothetical protein
MMGGNGGRFSGKNGQVIEVNDQNHGEDEMMMGSRKKEEDSMNKGISLEEAPIFT